MISMTVIVEFLHQSRLLLLVFYQDFTLDHSNVTLVAGGEQIESIGSHTLSSAQNKIFIERLSMSAAKTL